MSPGQSRWLSVHSCVKEILQQCDALTLYFTEAVFDDPYHGNDIALGDLKNPFMRIMMMFMDYVLGMLADFTVPLIHTLKLETKRLVATLSKNVLEVEYVNALKNPLDIDVNDDNYYVAIQNIYLGLNAQLAISELVECDPMVDHNDVIKVYLTAREFFKEAVA